MENTTIAIKDDEKLIGESNVLVEQANAFVIKDDLTFNQAVDLEKTLKLFLEGPGKYHDDEIEMAHALHKKLCSKRNAIIEHVQRAWKSLKDRRAAWQDQQQRKREEEQRRAEAEARRIEAEKQAKIQAKIDEENRKIREAQEEESRKQREKDAELSRIRNKEKQEQARREEEDRRKAEERRLEEERRRSAEKTAALEEKKESVYVAPRIVAPVSAPAGVSVQYSYEPVVENKALIPDIYKIVDLAGLARDQKSRKGELVVPGVRFNKKAIGSSRSNQ